MTKALIGPFASCFVFGYGRSSVYGIDLPMFDFPKVLDVELGFILMDGIHKYDPLEASFVVPTSKRVGQNRLRAMDFCREGSSAGESHESIVQISFRVERNFACVKMTDLLNLSISPGSLSQSKVV